MLSVCVVCVCACVCVHVHAFVHETVQAAAQNCESSQNCYGYGCASYSGSYSLGIKRNLEIDKLQRSREVTSSKQYL